MKYLIILLMLTGCSGTPLKRDQYKTKFNMKVIFVDNFSELERQFGYKNLAGLSIWGGNTCYIFVTMPQDQEDDFNMNTIGHETLHCVLGNFHK